MPPLGQLWWEGLCSNLQKGQQGSGLEKVRGWLGDPEREAETLVSTPTALHSPPKCLGKEGHCLSCAGENNLPVVMDVSAGGTGGRESVREVAVIDRLTGLAQGGAPL